jgi:uncharacterized protein
MWSSLRKRVSEAMKYAALVVLMFACSRPAPAPSDPPPPTPVAAGPRVILPNGFAYSVEIAADPDLRAQGLMYRDQLRPATGMLFFFPTDGDYGFWMKNTIIPLDMIWLDSARKVVHIKANAPPCKIEECPSFDPGVPSRYVLELAAGEAARQQLKVGDVLRFEGMDHVVVR